MDTSGQVEWDDPKPAHEDLSKDDSKDMEPSEIRAIGQVDQAAIEAMLVGYLLHDSDQTMPGEWETMSADTILEAGIRGSWFDDKALGESFDFLAATYKTTRRLLSGSDAANLKLAQGMTKEKSSVYEEYLARCLGSVLAWKIRADILVKLMKNKHGLRVANNIFKKFVREYADEAVGPSKSLETLRRDIFRELSDPGDGLLRSNSWVRDYEANLGWLKDMKRNPEKYRGYCCGIEPIDRKTNGGFRPSHLTVFVGKPGGYKTTMLINVAYGLWRKGYNVLYVSLEMEVKMLEAKLWARHTKELDYTKLIRGLITEPEDWARQEELAKALSAAGLQPADQKRLAEEKARLDEALQGVRRGREDTVLIDQYYKDAAAAGNELRIITAGQSRKIKMSQVEKYVRDVADEFRPNVVLVDYLTLTLLAPEDPRPDRPDLEIGEICTFMRSMGENLGFSVVTAAQFKRAALERIRKYGDSSPDKAGLGTDDIGEAQQIGNTADTVFMLWPMGNSELMMLCPKARHGAGGDTSKGDVLQIHDQHCLVSGARDEVQPMSERSKDITPEQSFESAAKLGGMAQVGSGLLDDPIPVPDASGMPDQSDQEQADEDTM